MIEVAIKQGAKTVYQQFDQRSACAEPGLGGVVRVTMHTDLCVPSSATPVDFFRSQAEAEGLARALKRAPDGTRLAIEGGRVVRIGKFDRAQPAARRAVDSWQPLLA